MKASIFDVAKRAGLSVVTVSRVLNGAGTVREKNRQKIMEAIKELDYRPSAAARSLARGKTGIIGLILTTLQDSFFDAVVKEINEALALHGYYLAVSVTREFGSDEAHYLIQEDRVDGLILLSPLEEGRLVSELKKRNIPYVIIDNQLPENTASSIAVDNYRGGYEAASHLLSLGHRNIAHLCGPELFLSTRERRSGFLDALKEAGMEPFAVEQGDYDIEFGYETARKWLADGTLPTAVFAGDDYIAIGFMNALMEAGVRVPEQLSVVGYDDQDIASRLRPFLTTVRQPSERIGLAAADMLLRKIDGKTKRSAGLKLKPELIIRQSTAARGEAN
ncbi:LacI family DNA-binding transcriptional regulator [Paenibacillus beijingensis]|uniref:LacI family transcriptional regulator n=1 Tax=Paenibacillus beijingensis TaxID=1126833 RepID=A0A0D5NEE9_9BACL|nr:LacI family DNA-binding transcriptional regulator [Paenibacillus beijingensis]AJY73347.1 LacI family transcriptional regulator [Paenibacillus beijingensis]